ncbi:MULTISPECIES: hypothetical protein [Alphaproteobacteria]|uniref:hypothetical protein n=1 Tax=Sphingopyxis sp. TaxID=1908224 RepID=UPI0040341363
MTVSPRHLAYLQDHHHIAESLIGIAVMHMTPDQLPIIAPYREQLSLLHINYLLDCGVPPEEIGTKGIFVEDDELVAKAMEARQGRDGEAGSVEDDSAVGTADLPEEPRS